MISQTAEYALRAVVLLGLQPDRYLTNRDIAERTKVPVFYLAKPPRLRASWSLATKG